MDSLSDVEYAELLTTIYAAGLDHRRWRDVLARIAGGFNHTCIALRGYDLITEGGVGFLTHNYDQAYIDAYVGHFAAANPWDRKIAQRPALQVQTSEDLLPRDALERSEFYHDWLRPQEDIGTGAGVTFFRRGTRLLRLSCNIRFSDVDRDQRRLVTTLEHLTPHLNAAFRLGAELRIPLLHNDLREVLELVPSSVVLVDQNGAVFHANGAAIGQTSGAFVLSARNTIRFASRDVEAWFRASLASVLAGSVSPPVRLVPGEAGGPQQLALYPFPAGQDPAFIPFRAFVDTGPVALLVASTTERPIDRFSELTDYDLSAAEMAVSALLLDGLSPQQIAERRGVSVYTVRNQIRAIFAKVGVSRQAEFVAQMTRAARHQGPVDGEFWTPASRAEN